MFRWARTTRGEQKHKQNKQKKGAPLRHTKRTHAPSTPQTLWAKKLKTGTGFFATPGQLSSAQHDREQVGRPQTDTIKPQGRSRGHSATKDQTCIPATDY